MAAPVSKPVLVSLEGSQWEALALPMKVGHFATLAHLAAAVAVLGREAGYKPGRWDNQNEALAGQYTAEVTRQQALIKVREMFRIEGEFAPFDYLIAFPEQIADAKARELFPELADHPVTEETP